MRILRNYILEQLLLPFAVCFCVVTFIFILGNLVTLADLLVNKGVGLFDILQILLFFIPKLLNFTIATSALTAILLVFGGLAQHNEITAMRASGVNIFHIMLPVLILSFLLSVVNLILSDQLLPRVQLSYRKAMSELFLKNPSAYIEAGKFIKEFDNYIILTQKVDGNKLEGVTIYQKEEGKPTRTILARRGEIISSKADKTVMLKLYDGTSDEPNPDDPTSFYKLDFETFVMPPFKLGFSGGKAVVKKTKEMTIDELVEKITEVRVHEPGDQARRAELNELRAIMHKKISFSFAPFIFALIGLPIAIISRRGEAIISFSLAMGIVAVYYGLFVWAMAVGKRGMIVPEIALYLPNALLIFIGCYLFRRIVYV